MQAQVLKKQTGIYIIFNLDYSRVEVTEDARKTVNRKW